MAGRSIRLFLMDGTPQGIRTAEVGNWTGLAIVCPRTDLARAATRPQLRQTGVYLLVGPSESSPSGLAVYVGEADDVLARLASHDNTKDFWNWVVVFVSKDANLTKAHVRWLEAALIREILQAKRAEPKNGNEPSGGKLPEADTADMEAYLDNVRLLLPTLGASILASQELTPNAPEAQPALKLELAWGEAVATCLVVDGQFVVQRGSTARTIDVDSLGKGYRTLRTTLRANGVLVPVAGSTELLQFTQAYAFDSPSAAAAVVSGTGLNGRAHWLVAGTETKYKEWEEQQLAAAPASDG